MQQLILVIEEDQEKSRLDKALSILCAGQLTRSRITILIQEGHVQTESGAEITNPATKVKEGESYLITIPVADDPDPVAEDIPLDILFVRSNGKILKIEHMAQPYKLRSASSEAVVAAVVELQGGRSRDLGIMPGDLIKHEFFGTTAP